MSFVVFAFAGKNPVDVPAEKDRAGFGYVRKLRNRTKAIACELD